MEFCCRRNSPFHFTFQDFWNFPVHSMSKTLVSFLFLFDQISGSLFASPTTGEKSVSKTDVLENQSLISTVSVSSHSGAIPEPTQRQPLMSHDRIRSIFNSTSKTPSVFSSFSQYPKSSASEVVSKSKSSRIEGGNGLSTNIVDQRGTVVASTTPTQAEPVKLLTLDSPINSGGTIIISSTTYHLCASSDSNFTRSGNMSDLNTTSGYDSDIQPSVMPSSSMFDADSNFSLTMTTNTVYCHNSTSSTNFTDGSNRHGTCSAFSLHTTDTAVSSDTLLPSSLFSATSTVERHAFSSQLGHYPEETDETPDVSPTPTTQSEFLLETSQHISTKVTRFQQPDPTDQETDPGHTVHSVKPTQLNTTPFTVPGTIPLPSKTPPSSSNESRNHNSSGTQPKYIINQNNTRSPNTTTSEQYIYRCVLYDNDTHITEVTPTENNVGTADPMSAHQRRILITTLIVSLILAIALFVSMFCVMGWRKEITIPASFGRINYALTGRSANWSVEHVPMNGIPGRLELNTYGDTAAETGTSAV